MNRLMYSNKFKNVGLDNLSQQVYYCAIFKGHIGLIEMINKILNSSYFLQYIFQIYGSNRGRVEITVGNHRNSSFYLLFLVNSQRVTSRKQSYLGASGGLKIFQAKKGDFVISFLSLLMFLDLLSTFFKGEQKVAGASRHCYFFVYLSSRKILWVLILRLSKRKML